MSVQAFLALLGIKQSLRLYVFFAKVVLPKIVELNQTELAKGFEIFPVGVISGFHFSLCRPVYARGAKLVRKNAVIAKYPGILKRFRIEFAPLNKAPPLRLLLAQVLRDEVKSSYGIQIERLKTFPMGVEFVEKLGHPPAIDARLSQGHTCGLLFGDTVKKRARIECAGRSRRRHSRKSGRLKPVLGPELYSVSTIPLLA